LALSVCVALAAATIACRGSAAAVPGTPSASTTSAAVRFLERYATADGRVIRRDQGGDIVSEGQALGMIIAEIAGRPDTALTIWGWTSKHLQRPDGLLAFHAMGDGSVTDDHAAADADILAAFALLRYQGAGATNLHRDGSRLASAVMAVETTALPNGVPVILAGPWAKGPPPVVDPSYWMPPIFRALATITRDPRWSRTATASLSLVDEITNGGRRLPPDWAHLDGSALTPSGTPSGSAGVQYGLDAARLAVWFAVDCSASGRRLAARWWDNLLSADDHTAAIALSLHGQVTDAAMNPLPFVAGAAAARAAGDQAKSGQLRARAASQSDQVPTYYGDAWLAVGGALLDRSLTTC
jgi:endoglucanase